MKIFKRDCGCDKRREAIKVAAIKIYRKIIRNQDTMKKIQGEQDGEKK